MLHAQAKYIFGLLFYLLTVNGFANPIDLETSFNVGNIEGHGFELNNIIVRFDSLLKRSKYTFEIESVLLPDNKGIVKNVVLNCYSGIVSKQEIACDDGEISFNEPLVRAEKAKISFSRKNNGEFSFELEAFNLVDATASLSAQGGNEKWSANLNSSGISYAKLKNVIKNLPELITSGTIGGVVQFNGTKASLDQIQGDVKIQKLEFADEESTIAGEGVSTRLEFETRRHKKNWSTRLNSSTYKGELYFDPVFLDANESAKDLYGVLDWQQGAKQIRLRDFHFEDSKSMHVELSMSIDLANKKVINPIRAKVNYALFPNVYENFIQPFLLDTNASDLNTSGSLSGEVVVDGLKITQASLDLGYLSLVDKQNRFSINNLNGILGWGSNYANKKYTFGFESLYLYKMRLDESEFSFLNHENALVLEKPATVPFLDGGINIESFRVDNPGKPDQVAKMDISLTPVSMYKVSKGLGWPEMNGNLAGYAPNVVYKKGDIEIGGALLVRGFGGTTTIHNLKAQDLFSVTPKLSADVKLTNLDLASLTETFSFGEITGRISGSVNNMNFVSWSPVAFDAWFATPDNDKSRHRISQTAVDNLTQVGNGGPNVLSKSFLKFFDSFGYDKLGVGCVLKNNTCKMRGVGRTENGFYIVKGSGIPRIDIVGFTDEVSWSVLTARLKRVVKSQDVIVN